MGNPFSDMNFPHLTINHTMNKNNCYRILLAFFFLMAGTVCSWAAVTETRGGVTYHVVYVSANGGGSKSGNDSSNPVKGWKEAYQQLSKTAGQTYEYDWEHNIIVVCGTMDLKIDDNMTNGGVPATITGVWPWVNDNGQDVVTGNAIQNGGKLNIKSDRRVYRIAADTRFKNVCFTATEQAHLCLFLHNTTFDDGCVMANMGTLDPSTGAMNTTTHKAPNFHLMLFSDEHDFTAHGSWNQTTPMTLTIKSGHFGRILCSRIAGTTTELIRKRYVIGKPDQPLMAKIVVDVNLDNNTSAYNPTGYMDDIAFLCAGTTQGSVYADVQMDIHHGKIATLVAGSQGNAIANCSSVGLPTSSYFGRTTVNVMGSSDNDVTIFRYFGACLGRLNGNTSGVCNAYFYGHSTLNLVHGTIEQDIYASAGGLSGLCNPNVSYLALGDDQHTSDPFIPYQGAAHQNYPFNGIDYSGYSPSKTIVQITTTLNGTPETIDLADTKIVTNIQGGLIKGNVYGGSFGFSDAMVVAAAPRGAGSLWGNTEINISGGTIQGSVFGGGGGSTEYYTQAASDKKDNFLNVATVYGNTNITITGTPAIQGSIYGGGAGVQSGTNEFLDIAKVYGHTNVLIDADPNWNFLGDVYGGGSWGSVQGNTNVIVLGGSIRNIYGAGNGEEGHSNKAQVQGSTNVSVGNGSIPNLLVNPEHQVTILGSVYGGGHAAKVESGSTSVVIDGSILSGSCSLPFQNNAVQGVFIRDFVFGGGFGSTASISGNTFVHIIGPKSTIGLNVYGGGNGGPVHGNTHVVIGN